MLDNILPILTNILIYSAIWLLFFQASCKLGSKSPVSASENLLPMKSSAFAALHDLPLASVDFNFLLQCVACLRQFLTPRPIFSSGLGLTQRQLLHLSCPGPWPSASDPEGSRQLPTFARHGNFCLIIQTQNSECLVSHSWFSSRLWTLSRGRNRWLLILALVTEILEPLAGIEELLADDCISSV